MPLEIVSEGVSMPSTKPDGLAIAEDSLLAEQERLTKELKAIQTLISNVRAVRISGAGEKPYPPVREHEYQGMRAVDALESYLRGRRGMKIPLSRIAQDLVKGGVNPGEPRGKKNDPTLLVDHTLRISLPNKRRLFSWEPDESLKGIDSDKITIWLATTADQPKRRKRP